MSLGLTDKLKKSPKIKKIQVNENGAVELSWSKVEGAEKYAVKRCTCLSEEFETVIWVKKCEYIDESVEQDTNYWYKITAWKKLEGKKTSTKTSAVKAVVSSKIASPKDIALAPQKKTGIKITWKNTEGVDGCIINRRNDFYKQILPIAKAKGEEFSDDGIVSGQVYHYSLQYFKDGERVRYGKFSKEIDCIHLSSGAILSLKGKFSRKVKLSLRLVAGADGYILLRSEDKDAEFKEVARTTSGFDLNITDKVESRFKNCYYAVCAYKKIENQEFVSARSKIVSKRGK